MTRRKPFVAATVARTPHVEWIGLVVILASLVAIGLATLTPQPPAKTGSHLCLVCGTLGVVNAVLNVFLFVPLGVGFGIYRTNWKRAVVLGAALSTAIELLQFLIIPGRYSTVGDVITNTIGTAVGFALGRYAAALVRPSPLIAKKLTLGWGLIWLGLQIVSNYGFLTNFPDAKYYGQLARSLGSFDVFRGLVKLASIGSITIPNTALQNSQAVRQLLRADSALQTTVIPASATKSVAPIVRIADNRGREIAIIAQNGTDLVFGLRTGASLLKLRPTLFAATNVFPARANGDSAPLQLRATHSPRAVMLDAESRTLARHFSIPFRGSLGWIFWLPSQWFLRGTRIETAISFMWLVALTIPLGYWSQLSTNRKIRPNDAWLIASVDGIIVLTGLVVLPLALGIAPASALDWCAVALGAIAGVVGSLLVRGRPRYG
jgi:hypothetical protein